MWGKGRGNWCLTREKSGGGPLINLGIHKLDHALFLTGAWPRVEHITGFVTSGVGSREAAAHGAVYDIEDYAFGMVRFVGGLLLTVEASYFLNLPGEVQDTVIIGTRGAIELSRGKAKLLTRTADGLVATMLEPDQQTATSCVEHFCRVLHGQEQLILTAEVGLQGLEIVEGIYQNASQVS